MSRVAAELRVVTWQLLPVMLLQQTSWLRVTVASGRKR
jgi:hypothetical protein